MRSQELKAMLRTMIFRVLLLSAAALAAVLPIHAENDGWTLVATDMEGEYVGAMVGNGCIGLLPWREPLSVRHVVLNHVFDADAEEGVSRVLKGINPFLIDIEVDGQKVERSNITNWSQTLDMLRAEHQTAFTALGSVQVTCTIRALRGLPHAAIVSLDFSALHDTRLQLEKRKDVPDTYFEPKDRVMASLVHGHWIPITRTSATSAFRKQTVAASSAFFYNRQDSRISCQPELTPDRLNLSLKRGEHCHIALIATVCTSRDFIDPQNEADRQTIYALMQGEDELVSKHQRLWNDLWQGDIEIEGDPEAQRTVRFALYNLYASVREGSNLSISPMGLSCDGYNGHVFWDAELWMLPPLLFLQPTLAEQLVNYRFDRLPAARKKAWSYGFQGAMFPWESDDAGQEACPTHALTGPFEHHITACVAIAAWQYYLASGNLQWLKQKGWPLLKAAADFWMSRVSQNSDGSWSIRNVVCADEYAEGVSDNAFTNAAVRCALEATANAARICGQTAEAEWEEVAHGLRILRLPCGATSEYDGYDGRTIKQADANLLGYPLGLIKDTAQLRTDLEYYAERIDQKNGPAMSYAIFSVQYARLGDADRAYKFFRRSYEPNVRRPFGTLAETSSSQNPYFMTGAGGLLQSVICGFGGLEVTPDGIRQLPSVLPKHWKRLTIKGVGPERKTYTRER